MFLNSLSKVTFEVHILIFTFKYAANSRNHFSIITLTFGNIFFDITHVRGRPFWYQNNGKWMMTKVKFSKDFFRHCSFHQHGRRVVRCNPFVLGNPKVLSMTSVQGDDIAKKWNQRKFKGRKRRGRKFSKIICIY